MELLCGPLQDQQRVVRSFLCDVFTINSRLVEYESYVEDLYVSVASLITRLQEILCSFIVKFAKKLTFGMYVLYNFLVIFNKVTFYLKTQPSVISVYPINFFSPN